MRVTRIIIINGSLRKNGATAYFLHRVEKTLAEQSAEVVFYDFKNPKPWGTAI